MRKLVPAAIAAAFTLSAAAAVPSIDLGPSSRLSAGTPAPAAGTYQLVHQGHDHIHGTGTVNSIDQAGHKVNLSHGPIPQVGWPAMTMDFAVASSVDLKSITPGMKVDFTLDKGPDGMFQIESLTPAKDAK